MECAEYGVQPIVLVTLIEAIISCMHVNTSLLKANEAKLRECIEFEFVPLGHGAVIIGMCLEPQTLTPNSNPKP
jgi:hypothetical protein